MAYNTRMDLRGIRQAGRRVFAALALLALLIPTARLAFACQVTPEGWSSVCCCAGQPAATCQAGDSCDAHLAGYHSGCCAVSLEFTDAVPAALNKAAMEAGSPQQPVAAIAVWPHFLPQTPSAGGVVWSSVPIAVSGRSLYLTTARLRI